jgi:hypothetical protein
VIDARLQRRLGPWPRRVGGRLFAPGPDGGPLWLRDPDELFAWIGRRLGECGQSAPRWRDGSGWVARATYFRHLQQFATPCAAAEAAQGEGRRRQDAAGTPAPRSAWRGASLVSGVVFQLV